MNNEKEKQTKLSASLFLLVRNKIFNDYQTLTVFGIKGIDTPMIAKTIRQGIELVFADIVN